VGILSWFGWAQGIDGCRFVREDDELRRELENGDRKVMPGPLQELLDDFAMPRKTKAENVTRFVIGSRVRVKIGMRDPDFPDLPLDGWSGKVQKIGTENGLPTYLVAWDRYTRRHIDPLFRGRCEEEDLNPDSMWLGEDFLEPEQSPPTVNEQPQNLFYRPIGMNSEERRSDRAPEPQSADEWQACEEPEPMLACLQCKASERKFRLFAVACCRRVWGLLRHDRYR
jgi:hypothetical protein